jgi:hypothetical protein
MQIDFSEGFRFALSTRQISPPLHVLRRASEVPQFYKLTMRIDGSVFPAAGAAWSSLSSLTSGFYSKLKRRLNCCHIAAIQFLQQNRDIYSKDASKTGSFPVPAPGNVKSVKFQPGHKKAPGT